MGGVLPPGASPFFHSHSKPKTAAEALTNGPHRASAFCHTWARRNSPGLLRSGRLSSGYPQAEAL